MKAKWRPANTILIAKGNDSIYAQQWKKSSEESRLGVRPPDFLIIPERVLYSNPCSLFADDLPRTSVANRAVFLRSRMASD